MTHQLEVEKEASPRPADSDEMSIPRVGIHTAHDQQTTGDGPESPTSNNVKRKRDATDAGLPNDDTLAGRPAVQNFQTELRESSEVRDEPESKRAKLDGERVYSGAPLSPHSAQLQRPKIHGLPPQLWKKILSLLPPVFLGRLLRVSREFNSLLTIGVSKGANTHEDDVLDPQTIWLASRRRYAAGLPEALPRQSELEMWKLIRGSSCQLCKVPKPLLTISGASDPWHSTQEDGMRVIWPFGVRCCASCLQDRVEQESSLHFSSSLPSFLLPTLPCVFLSAGKDYVHSWTVKNSTPPHDVQLSKVYYKTQLGTIKERFEQEKRVDPNAAKSWITNLEKENESRTEAVMKWEQWETKGGLKKVNVRPSVKPAPLSKQAQGVIRSKAQLQLSQTSSGQVTNQDKVTDGIGHIPRIPDSNGLLYASGTNRSVHLPNQQLAPGGLPPRPLYQAPGHRPERDLRDVTEAKASRRTEIERRCLALDPPIPVSILRHMDSFQAALQIPQPLTEQAWELLKPRLLDQRDAAEKEENERLERDKLPRNPAQDRTRISSQIAGAASEANALDPSQVSIQDRLSMYADERIRDLWSNGATVNKTTCPTFAADILLHIKRRFDDDQKEAASGSTTASLTEDVLTLEHMKWLFDNKIRPFTDPYQREIFLCSVCDGISKYYGFEAVVQHYAAKHTSALSQGSVVVHWRAKWPDQPPFHPNPSGPISTFTAPTLVTNTSHNYLHGVDTPTSMIPGTYGQPDLAPYPFAEGYPVAPSAQPFASPSYASQPGVPVQYPAPYAVAPVEYHPGPPPYSTAVAPPAYGPPLATNTQHSSQWPIQPSPLESTQQPNTFAASQSFQSQMSDMAKFAREIWFNTSGVKEMPASLRIYVVIQHMVNRFAQTYSTEPSLAMFLDGLNQNPLMRPVRSLNGLMCKTCSSHGGQEPRSEGERKLFTLPLLLNHFKSAHLDNPAEAVHLNWKDDMVQLPDSSSMLSLISAAGMDQTKLALITQVLPGVFPFPWPNAGSYGEGGGNPGTEAAHRNATLEKTIASERRSRSRTREAELAGEDEYDPHRPAYLEVAQAASGKRHSSTHDSEWSERRTARAHTTRQAKYLGTSAADYDPNEPLISHGREQDGFSSHPRHVKTEDLEADRFLDRLKPEIEKQSAPFERPIGARGTPPRASSDRHQYDPRHAEPSQLHNPHEQTAPVRPYHDRSEHASYERHGPPQFYGHPPNDQQAHGSGHIYQAPRGSYVETNRPPSHMHERERFNPGPSMREEQPDRPVYYYPADASHAPRPGVVYVAHSPDNYGPVLYRTTQLPNPYVPDYGHDPRLSGHFEDRGRRVEQRPVEDYPRDPRYHSPRGHPQLYAAESETSRAYGDGAYSGRPPHVEGEGRVLYRGYR